MPLTPAFHVHYRQQYSVTAAVVVLLQCDLYPQRCEFQLRIYRLALQQQLQMSSMPVIPVKVALYATATQQCSQQVQWLHVKISQTFVMPMFAALRHPVHAAPVPVQPRLHLECRLAVLHCMEIVFLRSISCAAHAKVTS